MKKYILVMLALTLSYPVYANECKNTSAYHYFKTLREVEIWKYTIELNKITIKLNQQNGNYRQAQISKNENILAEKFLENSFKKYKSMGGKARNYDDIEVIKNPCGNDYSNTKQSIIRDMITVEPTTRLRKEPVYIEPVAPFEFTTTNETAYRDFNLGENKNGTLSEDFKKMLEGNADRQQTEPKNNVDDLRKNIETGIQIFNILKK